MAGRQLLALLRRDLLLETRRLQTVLSMVIFAVVAMVVVRYGWSGDLQAPPGVSVTPGDAGSAGGSGSLSGTVPAAMLWVIFVFAAMLGLSRTFAHEREDDCLDGLLLCPVDRVVVFCAKAITNLALLLVMQVVTIPVFGLFFLEGSAGRLLACTPVVLLADIGLATVGTLVATMVLHARSRDLVLPVVLVPLLVPVVIAATSATAAIVDRGAPLADVLGRLGFLAAYDAIFLVLAWGTYDLLMRD
jgi:heme exporter protein B